MKTKALDIPRIRSLIIKPELELSLPNNLTCHLIQVGSTLRLIRFTKGRKRETEVMKARREIHQITIKICLYSGSKG